MPRLLQLLQLLLGAASTSGQPGVLPLGKRDHDGLLLLMRSQPPDVRRDCWQMAAWTPDTTPCNWPGVFCTLVAPAHHWTQGCAPEHANRHTPS